MAARRPRHGRALDSLELTIDELAAGGDGVGRAPDGLVVFVPFTAPGDRVRVRLVDRKAHYGRARVEALLEPGPHRTQPVCAVFGSCGGCSWQHVSYERQLVAKQAILRDALLRIGGLRPPEPLRVRPSPSPYGYRSRARVVVEGGRVGYRRRRSHALCAVGRCPVLAPELDARLAALAADPPARSGEWELALGADGARTCPVGDAGPAVEVAVGADRLRVSPGVFSQSNALLLEPLVASLHAAAGSGSHALELCAGGGFFTLGLARRFARVTAVESDAAAVGDLRHNLAAAGLANVDVIHARLEDALADGRLEGAAPDAVVLDPPRTGLSEGVPRALARLGAPRLVYLSCDPATLARDLSRLCFEGHRLVAVEGFDLFPQTPHVEALAVLGSAAGESGSAGSPTDR